MNRASSGVLCGLIMPFILVEYYFENRHRKRTIVVLFLQAVYQIFGKIYQRLSFLTIAQPLLALATAAMPFFAPLMSA